MLGVFSHMEAEELDVGMVIRTGIAMEMATTTAIKQMVRRQAAILMDSALRRRTILKWNQSLLRKEGRFVLDWQCMSCNQLCWIQIENMSCIPTSYGYMVCLSPNVSIQAKKRVRVVPREKGSSKYSLTDSNVRCIYTMLTAEAK